MDRTPRTVVTDSLSCGLGLSGIPAYISPWFIAPHILPGSANPVSISIMQFRLINVVDCLAISLSLYLLSVFRDHIRRGLPDSLGPPSRPIIGNLLDVIKAKESPWITYTEMSKKYGRRNILVTQVHSG
jgi:hypothetical protein